MRKFLSKVLNRKVLTTVLIAMQVIWWVVIFSRASRIYPKINAVFSIIGIFVIIYIINRDNNPSYKLAWVLPIMVFPLFGVIIYLLYSNKRPSRYLRKKFKKSKEVIIKSLEGQNMRQEEEVIEHMQPRDASRAGYLLRSGYLVYSDTQTTFYPSGEEMLPSILEEISKAERFIFLEYFIIEEGEVWSSILKVLAEKAKAGVDVRVIYDDVGSVSKLPTGYNLKLSSKGIKSAVFNPFVPFISGVMNNRDHRKILVVDGHTSFTGGINLADEYMNLISPYGYWKDSAVMLRGKASWSFTYMFLDMWNVITGASEDFNSYRFEIQSGEAIPSNGFVQPFSDSPLDDEAISQRVYIDIITQAEKYVYICTPYLIIDDEMKNALSFAAKRGVDVRIITPGIPDKKIVYRLTRSYYPSLIAAGVKIYEYTPGFVHAKSIVCDDKTAVVGTINMDFRSLYLHFECGVLMTGTSAVISVRDDAVEMFGVCREIKIPYKRNLVGRVFDSVLRTFAPLM